VSGGSVHSIRGSEGWVLPRAGGGEPRLFGRFLPGTTERFAGTPTLLASSGTNKAFRGVAFVPLSDLTASVSGPTTATARHALRLHHQHRQTRGATVGGVSAAFTLPAGVTYNSATVAGGFFRHRRAAAS